MNKLRPYLIPFFLFLLSFLLRLSLISKGSFHVDCLNLAIQAEQTLETHSIHHLFGSGYPLTVILGAIFILISRIFSVRDPVIAVNLMSVVFSSLCVLANYSLVKKLLGKTAALFSSILLSLFPPFLVLSVYGKSHTPSLFFLLAGISSLLSFQTTGKKQHIRRSGNMPDEPPETKKKKPKPQMGLGNFLKK